MSAPAASRGLALPPRRLRFMGESDDEFIALGDGLAAILERHAELGDATRLLDIGCGYGRLPHALRRRRFRGSYLGIDVQRPHIRWCRRHLATASVRFEHVDLRNERYNRRGRSSVADLDLGGERFDVICAFSLFTHMWPDDVDAYLRFAAGALAPNGRLIATVFLIEDHWRSLKERGRVRLTLPYERAEYCRYESEDDPLHVVAYEAAWFVQRALAHGLVPIVAEHGTWSGRPVDVPDYQDVAVFRPA